MVLRKTADGEDFIVRRGIGVLIDAAVAGCGENRDAVVVGIDDSVMKADELYPGGLGEGDGPCGPR